jgi:hypothetical protein
MKGTVMNLLLNNLSRKQAFLTYWRQHVQGRSLADLIGLPFILGSDTDYCDDLILRLETIDISFIVDSAGARVRVDKFAVSPGQEVDPIISLAMVDEDLRLGWFPLRREDFRLSEVIALGREHFNYSPEDWQTLVNLPRKRWQRLEQFPVIGKRIDEITFEDTDGAYCSKVLIRIENYQLILEDIQDSMMVQLYPS